MKITNFSFGPPYRFYQNLEVIHNVILSSQKYFFMKESNSTQFRTISTILKRIVKVWKIDENFHFFLRSPVTDWNFEILLKYIVFYKKM